MQPMSDMIAALEAHHDELHKYFSEWSKNQRKMLETIYISAPSPYISEMEVSALRPKPSDGTLTPYVSEMEMSASRPKPSDGTRTPYISEMEVSPLRQKPTDGILTVDAVSILVPASCKEGETADVVATPTGQTIGTSANGHQTQVNGVLSSVAGREDLQAQAHNGHPTSVERYRLELVDEVQVRLNNLKALKHKEDVIRWLNETLSRLEDSICSFDIIDMPEEPEAVQKTEKKSESGGVYQPCWNLARRIVSSQTFELVSATVILVNAVVLGFSADDQMKNLDGLESESRFLHLMETVFFIYYTVEILLRFYAQGRQVFTGVDCLWNFFDLVIVLMSTGDQMLSLVSSEDGIRTMNISFLRLWRLLKTAKLLRVFRLMKMYKQSRLILASVLGSTRVVLWAGVLVLIITYLASILFVSLCANYLVEAEPKKLVSSDVQSGIEEYWGSVFKGMNSLYGATSGGNDWFNIAAPLKQIGSGCYLLFILYIGFFDIVILNTFSSLFVQVVMENQERDEQAIIRAELEGKNKYVAALQEFFDQIDDDCDGTVSMKEFLAHADDPKLKAWASHLGIDLTDAKDFFEVLSYGGTESVDMEDFVVGCIKLKGTAKSVDLVRLFQLSKESHKRIDECDLMLRSMKRSTASAYKTTQKTGEMVHSANPLPMLTHISRNQMEMMAQISRLATSKTGCNKFSL